MLTLLTQIKLITQYITKFGKQLTMSNTNWSSGTCTVTGSSDYWVYAIVQGGAIVLAHRDPTGTAIRGIAASGSNSSGNYNQYVRVFGATMNLSTEVWTMEWAKQVSHITTSGYHTSGTEQAVTKIYGLIPLPFGQ